MTARSYAARLADQADSSRANDGHAIELDKVTTLGDEITAYLRTIATEVLPLLLGLVDGTASCFPERKTDKCAHGLYSWEMCTNCYDEVLERAIALLQGGLSDD